MYYGMAPKEVNRYILKYQSQLVIAQNTLFYFAILYVSAKSPGNIPAIIWSQHL